MHPAPKHEAKHPGDASAAVLPEEREKEEEGCESHVSICQSIPRTWLCAKASGQAQPWSQQGLGTCWVHSAVLVKINRRRQPAQRAERICHPLLSEPAGDFCPLLLSHHFLLRAADKTPAGAQLGEGWRPCCVLGDRGTAPGALHRFPPSCPPTLPASPSHSPCPSCLSSAPSAPLFPSSFPSPSRRWFPVSSVPSVPGKTVGEHLPGSHTSSCACMCRAQLGAGCALTCPGLPLSPRAMS